MFTYGSSLYLLTDHSFHAGLPNMPCGVRWTQNGDTVAGGNGEGNASDQLFNPWSLYVDDDQTVLIADYDNHRIVEWKPGATNGQVLIGGNGPGNRTDQLNGPADVIVDKETDSLIICERENRRVTRWSRRNRKSGETIIENIDCWGLTIDNQGFLYVSDTQTHEVRRYRLGETNVTVVAGGNGLGDHLNQLHFPTYIFVSQDHSIYVSDNSNNRVVKWVKDAKEGIVVAGDRGERNDLIPLYYPKGVFVDSLGTVYVADSWNDRVMRWCNGSTQENVILGENGKGQKANQLYYPMKLSFDSHGNLYVVDNGNNRVQRFSIEVN
ncbi:unnamed protein product [Rotaria sp. Silwood2]|nr:unnamed protein product [Rotaria sp. Silwood2]CAF2849834.1 unnamed protein product [Rotaria sp. Silwood2]CAF3099628.1 unnamed protein product [Rotaria sp. Silwood2]CAF3326287.1 unnamed protein product [Rotaria sp. Silwood2]CAF3873103.1 unnamed protein product [Rotaria sp. Silwood2]